MNLINKIKSALELHAPPPERVRLTRQNIAHWPKFSKLLNEGKVKFDHYGRLRYAHGAPVGDLILVRVNKDGTLKYKESAEEWFDPQSPKAKGFNWNDPPL